MDYKTLLLQTQTKMAVFLDRRVSELLETTFRQELEDLAEKICFQNLVNQYRKRKLALPVELEKRLNYERFERKSAKAERRVADSAENPTGGLLSPTPGITENSGD